MHDASLCNCSGVYYLRLRAIAFARFTFGIIQSNTVSGSSTQPKLFITPPGALLKKSMGSIPTRSAPPRIAEQNRRLRKSCGRPGQFSPQVNINCNYVKSPQPGKPRKWPPDTCGMAFEKLILLLLAGVTASRTLRCRSQRPTVLEHHPCRSSPSRA